MKSQANNMNALRKSSETSFDDLCGNKKYNVGVYLRLSQEDEKVGQSESIVNQNNFVRSYVLEKGWSIVDTYIEVCDIIEPTLV